MLWYLMNRIGKHCRPQSKNDAFCFNAKFVEGDVSSFLVHNHCLIFERFSQKQSISSP